MQFFTLVWLGARFQAVCYSAGSRCVDIIVSYILFCLSPEQKKPWPINDFAAVMEFNQTALACDINHSRQVNATDWQFWLINFVK